MNSPSARGPPCRTSPRRLEMLKLLTTIGLGNATTAVEIAERQQAVA